MIKLRIIASALALGALGGTPIIDAAFAIEFHPAYHAASRQVVPVACARGNPNCLPTDPTAPTMCGGPGNPCVIDNGPDCQNASSCGTDNTGDHNLNGASNMPGVISDAKHPTGRVPVPKPVSGGTTMKAQVNGGKQTSNGNGSAVNHALDVQHSNGGVAKSNGSKH